MLPPRSLGEERGGEERYVRMYVWMDGWVGKWVGVGCGEVDFPK